MALAVFTPGLSRMDAAPHPAVGWEAPGSRLGRTVTVYTGAGRWGPAPRAGGGRVLGSHHMGKPLKPTSQP